MGLLEMSISASVLILLVAVLRGGKWGKLSGRTVMALWLVVLARLLLPGCLPIQHGIAAPVFRLLRRAGILYTDLQKAAGTKAAALAVPKAASFGTAGVADSSPLMEFAFYTWLAGLAAAGICFAAIFWKEQRLLAEALPWEKMPDECKSRQEASFYRQLLESYQSASRLTGRSLRKKSIQILVHDRIPSPLVFGIVRQKIVIPKGMVQLTQTQMQHILTHEMVHIRRHDNLWKLIAAAAACIHWFNPAVWLMYVLFARDLEIACDEQVLSAYGAKGRKEYAATLLTLAQIQKETMMFCSGFLENPVKERIVAIMKYKKLTGIGVLCAVMLLAGASSVFATNEQETQTEDANIEVNRADLQSKDAEEKFANYLTTEKEDKVDKKSSNNSLIESEEGADGKFVSYSIMKDEDGKEVVEKSGKGKIKKIGGETILVEVGDTESLPDGENIQMTFHGASDIQVNVNELESGKTYEYHADKEKLVKLEEYEPELSNAASEDNCIVVDEQRSFEVPESVETENAK